LLKGKKVLKCPVAITKMLITTRTTTLIIIAMPDAATIGTTDYS